LRIQQFRASQRGPVFVQGSQLSPSLALYFKTYRVYDIRGRDTILEAGSDIPALSRSDAVLSFDRNTASIAASARPLKKLHADNGLLHGREI
jgi:hypothetical protein